MILPPLRLVPQAGPATWSGADLTPADWMLPIGAEEAAELETAPRPGAAGPSSMPRLTPLMQQVAERLENGRGFVLLRGLPLERFDAVGGPEAALRPLGALLGTPLPQDAAGALVTAQAEEEAQPIGPVRFQADPADAVLLLCLRQATQGGSVTLVFAPALHNALLKSDRATLTLLHEGLPQREAGAALVPVFSTAGGVFVGRCDRQSIAADALSGAQGAALAALEAAAEAPGQALTLPLHPGDVLVRNPLLVWKRAPPAAGQEVPEAAWRALLRLWVSTPNSRALPESFRPIFGRTEAGALRGGITSAPTGGAMVGG